jgi:hypothetical protein
VTLLRAVLETRSVRNRGGMHTCIHTRQQQRGSARERERERERCVVETPPLSNIIYTCTYIYIDIFQAAAAVFVVVVVVVVV